MEMNGQIIRGEFNRLRDEYTLQMIKQFPTETILTKKQLDTLYEYLNKHKFDRDGQVLTLYDQMPVLLKQSEINQLLTDLDQIRSEYRT